MSITEKAIRNRINTRIQGKYGHLLEGLLKGKDPYSDHRLREEAVTEINALSNFELLELIDKLTAETEAK